MRINPLKMLERIYLSRHAEILSPEAGASDILLVMVHEMFRLAFWLFILFLALSFFGISIQAIVNSPAGQENILYLSDLLTKAWLWSTEWIRPM